MKITQKNNRTMCHHSKESISKKEKIIHIQKDPQEVQKMNKVSFPELKQKLQDETQGYLYAQSSKFSSVARQLTFGILGTVWVMIYSEGNLNFPNRGMFFALIFALAYLSCDASHYISDSISYHKELFLLDKYQSFKEIQDKHEPFMDAVNVRSFIFLIFKFVILFCSCISFIFGLIDKVIP